LHLTRHHISRQWCQLVRRNASPPQEDQFTGDEPDSEDMAADDSTFGDCVEQVAKVTRSLHC
jgi:hypothetical protein